MELTYLVNMMNKVGRLPEEMNKSKFHHNSEVVAQQNVRSIGR